MSEEKIYSFPKSMKNVTTHYCAGCGHGIVHKLIAQIMDELGIQEKTLVIAPVGCSVLAYNYLKADGLEAAHGRAPAVSTGLKRVQKDKVVICYQGDGDLLAIGTAETVHAANRGEHITVIFINNAIYGMTGGQMAPTTMEGQVTKTTPYGRNPQDVGWPIRACELLNTLEAPYYIERCAVYDVKHINQTKKAIKKAIQNQIDGKGYSFVEILSMCPTNWGVDPVKAAEWVRDVMEPYYPVKCFRDGGEKK
ncbi:MAG: 2-oxoglutarate oxidoreductase [Spirochaetia bacterium]|nr:2-oxoglutarate oxidoreductase [Spirochaetia bacterium]MBR4436351.1 2-oxoglutarate oxidoreductase [Spirochaetales bacterium]MBR4796524.1 2-oxoglutarate oxidoreductase [Spirochaetia bacterium]MBR5017958.1 2-oxoglutarate oxidoreductase [Spirochaetia bacterium]MBR5914910.1 2-oxoglutarate oxidoreductase [Spirochaetia bacterium]